jgi:palmitoyltransferase
VARTGKPPLLDSSQYTYPHRNGAPPISETAKSDSIIGHGRRSQTHEPTPLQGDDSVAGPSYEHMLQSDSTPSHPLQVTEPNVGSLDAIMQPRLATDNKLSISTEQLESSVSQESQHTTSSVPSDARRVRRLSRQAARSNRLDELNVYRKPSSTPVLEPVFRYCERDALVKPYRAHHCRACGTVSLKLHTLNRIIR